MIDDKRKLLTAALGECWHEWVIESQITGWIICNNCKKYPEEVGGEEHRTFTDAQDYEDLLEKVVRPNLHEFVAYVWAGQKDKDGWLNDAFAWWLTLSIEERCKLICDFGTEVLGWT